MGPGPIWRKVKFALWAVRLYGAVRHKESGRSGSASILGRENRWHPNVQLYSEDPDSSVAKS
jgi:hypothetical protein